MTIYCLKFACGDDEWIEKELRDRDGGKICGDGVGWGQGFAGMRWGWGQCCGNEVGTVMNSCPCAVLYCKQFTGLFEK